MKRLIFALVFAVSLVMGGSSSMATNISTLAQLQAMNTNLTEDYVLVNDINALDTINWNSPNGFIPVGSNGADANRFRGSFDGQGHTIYNLYINRPGTDNVGLFGVVNSNKDFKNVTLANCDITGKNNVGGLIGWNHTLVPTISNCHITGEVAGQSSLGGLIGHDTTTGTNISNCHSETKISASGANVNLYRLGGLIGYGGDQYTLSNCYATGDIVSGDTTGGKNLTLVGGLIGFGGDDWKMTNCYATGNIRVGNSANLLGYLGGLAGSLNRRGIFENCFATGNIQAGDAGGILVCVGGFMGAFSNDCVTSNCHALGSVKVGNAASDITSIGGFFGFTGSCTEVTGSSISRCCSRGSIETGNSGRDIKYIGGFIGECYCSNKLTSISECYSLGSINVGNATRDLFYLGGFIGDMDSGCSIGNCYARGNIVAGNVGNNAHSLGGLVGINQYIWGAELGGGISKCYSIGSVSIGSVTGTTSDIGGLIGTNNGTVSKCFWDTQISGTTFSNGGTGKTTAEMQLKSTFSNALWNFITIWDILSYPGLREIKCCDLVEEEGNYQIRIGKYYIKCEADKQNLLEANFTLRQNGGCAEFSIAIGAPDYTVSLGDEVLIYLFGQVTPWYRGRVLERSREGSSSRVRAYVGYGHFEFLSGGDLVDVTYGTGQPINDLRLAIIDILDTYVRPHSPYLTNINTKIVVPAIAIQEMKFDKVKPIDALTDLCELATGYEFGVDETGDFYFRLESSAILEHKWVGKHVATFLPTEDMRKLVNRWYLEGGDLVAGTNYDSLVENLTSQGIYQLRSDKATIPSGMNNQEIARWGTDLLAKTDLPKIKATTTGIDIERTRTRIWPRGQMRLTGEDGLPSPPDSFPIRTVTYHITPKGITADVELGEKKASLKDPITTLARQIKKEQEQLASDVLQLADGTGIMPDSITETHIQPMPLVYLALFKDEL